MRIDKKEGQGRRVGLHWETLGVGVFAMVPENARGGDRRGGGCILMFCTGELLRNFPAGRGVRFVFS